MNQKEEAIKIWPFIRYGVPIAIILFLMVMTELKDVGQFVKFLLFDVIRRTFWRIVFLRGCFYDLLLSYMIIRLEMRRILLNSQRF